MPFLEMTRVKCYCRDFLTKLTGGVGGVGAGDAQTADFDKYRRINLRNPHADFLYQNRCNRRGHQ